MERQVRRRRRPALSCFECRRRKIKCDRGDPCGHCVLAKVTCSYRAFHNEPNEASQQPRSPPSPSISSHSAPGQSVGTNRGLVAYSSYPFRPTDTSATTAPEISRAQANTPVNLERAETSQRSRSQEPEPDLQNLLLRVQRLENSGTSEHAHGLSETGRNILARQSGLKRSQIMLNKSRTLTWSHWMGTAQEFDMVGSIYFKLNGKLPTSLETAEAECLSGIKDLMLKCKDVAKRIKQGRPSRSLSNHEFDLTLPPRELADAMVRAYFQSFESTFRILHEPSFWTELRRYCANPEDAPTDLRLKVHLVIGIGSSVYGNEYANEAFRTVVHQWIYAAQSWLSGPLEKDRLALPGLQIYCLTILARQIFSIGGDLAWMSMGSLIHRAMQIGLHRDPKHIPGMSVLQAELRRRLWATILELVVQSSLDSAMPARISYEEFDTEAPSNYNDNEIDESTTELQPHARSTYTSTSTQIMLLDTLPIRLRILQLLNSLRSELPYTQVLELSSELTDAIRACRKYMRKNEASGVTAFHRNMLDYLLRRFVIPLHCLFASQARTNPLFQHSLKASVEAAIAMTSHEPDEGFSHLMILGGGWFREGIRYALSAICLELVAQTDTQYQDGTLQRNPHYRESLKQAIRDTSSLFLERIRQGETNIKSHTLLEMILTQVEGMERGAPSEHEMAESARKSLVLCYDILQTRAATMPATTPSDTGLTVSGFDSGLDDFGMDFNMEYFFFSDAVFP